MYIVWSFIIYFTWHVIFFKICSWLEFYARLEIGYYVFIFLFSPHSLGYDLLNIPEMLRMELVMIL